MARRGIVSKRRATNVRIRPACTQREVAGARAATTLAAHRARRAVEWTRPPREHRRQAAQLIAQPRFVRPASGDVKGDAAAIQSAHERNSVEDALLRLVETPDDAEVHEPVACRRRGERERHSGWNVTNARPVADR